MSDDVGSGMRRRAGPGVSERLLSFGAIWLLVAGYSFLRVPVPGVNEPHYLAKAKAFWNPDWCAGDLFLESSSPHRAFYLTIGWLTQHFTLAETAIIGRCAALAVVAWGWRHFCFALGFRVRGSLASMGILLLLQTLGSWSGEWLIGGVEAKVFAYGLVFAGLGAFVSGRSTPAAIWLGLATTMHPLVGGWATVAVIVAAAVDHWLKSSTLTGPADSSRIRRCATTMLWWIIAAMPGILWAMPAARGDAAQSLQADFIQVGYRLAHHLDPWTFARANHIYFACLVGVWLVLRFSQRFSDRLRRFDAVVTVSVAIGLAALALSYGPRPWPLPLSALAAWQLKLLKFYPFRLSDMLTEVAVAVSAVEFWRTRCSSRPISAGILASAAYAAAIVSPNLDQNPSRMTVEKRRDWRETMAWLRSRTPPGAMVLGANEDWAIKWFAERREFSNFKDCPQDPRSLVEWNSRLRQFAQWTQASFANDGKISAEELAGLKQQTGIDFLICGRLGPFSAEPVFANESFRVYATGPQSLSR